MKSTRVAAIAGAGMMFVTAPALAGVSSVAGRRPLLWRRRAAFWRFAEQTIERFF
jgi:hypothetical protein